MRRETKVEKEVVRESNTGNCTVANRRSKSSCCMGISKERLLDGSEDTRTIRVF